MECIQIEGPPPCVPGSISSTHHHHQQSLLRALVNAIVNRFHNSAIPFWKTCSLLAKCLGKTHKPSLDSKLVSRAFGCIDEQGRMQYEAPGSSSADLND